MHRIFGYDSPLMGALTRVGDCICLSVLWVVFSLPIFTMGAATVALYAAAYRCIRKNEGSLWHTFWDAFRGEFKRSTLVWLVAFAVMAILTVDVFVFRSIKLTGGALGNLYWLSLVIWCLALTWTVYLAAYTARFTGSVRETLRFGYLLILLHPIKALGVLLPLLGGLAIVLMVPFMALAAPAVVMLLCSFSLEKVFLAHMRPEDKETLSSHSETEETRDDQ